MEDRNKIIGLKIAKARENFNESQEKLADALGVSRVYVTYWENGTRPIKAETIIAIANRYNVSADYLLGLAKSPTREGTQQAAEEYTGLSGEAVNTLRSFLDENNERSLETSFVDALLTSETFKKGFLQALINVFFYERDAQTTICDVNESEYPYIEAAKRVEQFRRDYDHIRISVLDYNESCQELLNCILPELKQITEKLRSVVNSRHLNQAEINVPSFADYWKYIKGPEGGK